MTILESDAIYWVYDETFSTESEQNHFPSATNRKMYAHFLS